MVFAAVGEKVRTLSTEVPSSLNLPDGFSSASVAIPGVLSISGPKYESTETAREQSEKLCAHLKNLGAEQLEGFPLLVISDDGEFAARTMNNFLWVTFTRSNPSHDIYGMDEFVENKHWGCKAPIIIDARIKPHHAPLLDLSLIHI